MRLAYERGCLTGPEHNQFQRWALIYTLNTRNRESAKNRAQALKEVTFALAPKRFGELYLSQSVDPGLMGEDQNIGLDDLDAVERFLREEDSIHEMTGAEDTVQRWSDWL